MEKRQRTRLASAGVLMIVFASGAVAGMAIDRSLMDAAAAAQVVDGDGEEQPGRGNGSGAGAGGERERPVQRGAIYEQVGLSPDQLEVADSLVRAHRSMQRGMFEVFRGEMDSLMVPVRAREQRYQQVSDSLTNELRDKIRGLMTPDQRADYNARIQARLDEEARRRAEREERSGNRSPD